jgi:hypothetical protein
MIKAVESVSVPANLLDDEVNGLGAAVADAMAIEVGQDLDLRDAEGCGQVGRLQELGLWKLS